MNSNQVKLCTVKATNIEPTQDFIPLVAQISLISRSDRWLLAMRLNQLDIPSRCPSDGSLLVEINNSLQAILVRSVVQQMVISRAEKINWLERCWDSWVSNTSKS